MILGGGVNEIYRYNITEDTIDTMDELVSTYKMVTRETAPFTNVLTVSPEDEFSIVRKNYTLLQGPDYGFFDDIPQNLMSGDSVVYRDVRRADIGDGSVGILVTLTEVYPVNGRVWTRYYNGVSWDACWHLNGQTVTPVVVSDFDDPPDGEYWFNITENTSGTKPPVEYGYMRVTAKNGANPRMMIVYDMNGQVYTRIYVNGLWFNWNTV